MKNVEADPMIHYIKFWLYPPYNLRGVGFLNIFLKFSFSVAMATNQIKKSGQNNIFRRGLLKEHFCKTSVRQQ